MAFLQLADNYSMLAQNQSENYIFIPSGYAGASKDMNVREDYFDNLSDVEYMAMMQELLPFQSQGLSAVGIAAVGAGAFNLGKKLVARRQARVAAGTAKPLFKPGGLIAKIGDRLKSQQAGGGDMTTVTNENNMPVDTRGGGSGSFEFNVDDQTEPKPTFFEKNKMLLLIGGGALLVGGIFLATRKKRR